MGNKVDFVTCVALLNGDYSMKQTEEHHVVFGAGATKPKRRIWFKGLFMPGTPQRRTICTTQQQRDRRNALQDSTRKIPGRVSKFGMDGNLPEELFMIPLKVNISQ